MKRFIKGFTLAEVILTLGIVGVIASLTLPALNNNIQRQQYPTALAKAINTLENANRLALQEAGARSLDELVDDKTDAAAYFEQALANYVNFTKYDRKNGYYNYSLDQPFVVPPTMYNTTDGITYYAWTINYMGSFAHLGHAYSGKWYTIYVDVNGNLKAPNALGRDLFILFVDTKGVVIPYGGLAFETYINTSDEKQPPLWLEGCSSKKADPTNPASCAGSIVDNGFKLIY